MGAFHFSGDGDHFVEGGGDQAGESDGIGTPFLGFFEDGFPGDHDADVFDFEVVAGEDHADDVFANVVDIAFDGGE